MVQLENQKTVRTATMSNEQVLIVLDALEAQMQRYNEAADAMGTTADAARKAIREAVHQVFEIHSMFCDMLNTDEDTDEDTDGEKLPKNVLARLDYAGQALDTQELQPLPEVDVNGALPYTLNYIRMCYPFEIEGNGEYNVYRIAPATTWGELLTETVKVFQREYKAGKAITPHSLGDYIIERIDIHPGDIATVGIGS